MTLIGWIQILLYCAIVAALVVPLGGYMTRVFNGERTVLSPVLRPVEAALFRIGGVDERREQHWVTYTVSLHSSRRRPEKIRALPHPEHSYLILGRSAAFLPTAAAGGR
jgi:hypothetical protein